MKKRLIMIVIAFVMLLCPTVVFAEEGDQPTNAPGWNADRTIYYDKDGQPTTGLFKAQMTSEVNALFFANKKGVVKKTSGVVTVAPPNKRYLRSKDSEGHWGFRPVVASNNNTYKYLVGTTGTGAIVEDEGIYTTDDGKKYYVKKNGTLKSTSGLVDVNGKKYFVNKYGRVRTNQGWLYHNGKKYYVLKSGVVRTREGLLIVNGNRYIVQSNGSVCRRKGAVKSDGKVYYVRDTKGHLGKKKAYTLDGKTYHVNQYGVVYVGRHKWNDKYYFSVNKGYLRTKSGTVTVKKNGKRFFVEKGGLILTDQKISYDGKQFIAGKDGYFKTGLFSWNGNLWYANKYGVLKKKAGIIKVGDYSYYVASGGQVYVDQKFKVNGSTYIADSDGHLKSGFFRWSGRDYYADSEFCVYVDKKFKVNGKLYISSKDGHLMSGKFKWYGNAYLADDNHVVYVDKKLKSNGYTYIADSDGHLMLGKFRWNGNYYITNSKYRVYVNKKFTYGNYTYIADSDGHLQSGFFKWGKANYSFYADSNYHLFINKKFQVGNDIYLTGELGHLKTGVFKWNGSYYYCDSNFVLDTEEEFINYNSMKYFNKDGGGLACKEWVKYNGKYYYAGNKANILTSPFQYNDYEVWPDSDGAVDKEQYLKVTGQAEVVEEGN